MQVAARGGHQRGFELFPIKCGFPALDWREPLSSPQESQESFGTWEEMGQDLAGCPEPGMEHPLGGQVGVPPSEEAVKSACQPIRAHRPL